MKKFFVYVLTPVKEALGFMLKFSVELSISTLILTLPAVVIFLIPEQFKVLLIVIPLISIALWLFAMDGVARYLTEEKGFEWYGPLLGFSLVETYLNKR